jgi:diguanylate cyclase (GGDEF)-like protein
VLTTIAAFLFIPVAFAMTRLAGTPLTTRVRFSADALIVGLFAYLPLTLWTVWPAYRSVGLTFDDAALATTYTVFGALLIAGVAATASPLKTSRWQLWERFVAAGILVYGLATLISPLWHAAAAGHIPATWLFIVEGLWTGGYALLAMGAAFRLSDSAVGWRPSGNYTLASTRLVFLPMALISVALVSLPLLMAYANTLSRAGSPKTAALVTGVATAMGIVIVIRMGALGAEFGGLTRRTQSDPLTGLANHRALYDYLEAALEQASSDGKPVSVLLMDVDGFRRANAQFGHQGGDRLLVEIARRVASVAGRDHLAARPAGDEFVLVLTDTPATRARVIAEGLRGEVLAASAGLGLPLTASIGVATFPDHALNVEELLRHVDGAQFWAKCTGRARTVVFDPGEVVALDLDERLGHAERESHMRTARALAAAVDARDPATQYHSLNVARLAGALSRELGFDEERASNIELAGTLHDVGKIGIPDDVLFKRGKLTQAEWRHVRNHPELGEGILRSTTMTALLPWVRGHHERWDGAGYPDGLREHEIPVEARILAICDAFDAMVSERPYRARMSAAAALQEIDLNLGTQFDPVTGEVFIRLISQMDFEPRAVSV